MIQMEPFSEVIVCIVLQVLSNRLVNYNGIINVDAFYNYLTAWVSNDALAYAASMGDFHPVPKQWIHDPADVELKGI